MRSPGTALGGFESYIRDRCQSLIVDGIVSAISPLVYGVHRGSVLGPAFVHTVLPAFGSVLRYHKLYHVVDFVLYSQSFRQVLMHLSWMKSNNLVGTMRKQVIGISEN